jgi:hypothetical protein
VTEAVNQESTTTMLASNTLYVQDVLGQDFMTVSIFPSSPLSGAAVFSVNGAASVLVNLADATALRDFLSLLIAQAD